MTDLRASPADQNMRSAVLMIGLVCLAAAGFTALNQWPELSLYGVLIAVAGGVFIALYVWAPIAASRAVCNAFRGYMALALATNSALVSDACAAALRAFFSAAQRGR